MLPAQHFHQGGKRVVGYVFSFEHHRLSQNLRALVQTSLSDEQIAENGLCRTSISDVAVRVSVKDFDRLTQHSLGFCLTARLGADAIGETI